MLVAELDPLLPFVEKPARYIGGESGIAPRRPGRPLVVLGFPDVYEIGMSNKGLGNLYGALAACDEFQVARVFAPWDDMGEALRGNNIPLPTLETGEPVRNASLLGISLPSPLNFTTALYLLDLAGIPLRAADRREGDPLVIAGGHAVFNAEPIKPFFDALFVGEGDEAIVEIAKVAAGAQGHPGGRERALADLSVIPGVYVPSAGRRDATTPVYARRVIPGARGPYVFGVVAHIPPVHDRAAIEVARGCKWGCRFCQAGFVTRPYRERPMAETAAHALATLARTGADEIGFLALNACDYGPLPGLASYLRQTAPQARLSLPSARVGSLTPDNSASIHTGLRSQQTLAPETGKDGLRRSLNKGFTNDEFLAAIRELGRAGCRNVKLYFMVGLPNERDEDAAAIGELVAAARTALREGLGRWGNVAVTLAPFVPQPHTPLQWAGMAPAEVIARRIRLARDRIPRPVKVESGNLGPRVLEACLARGDDRLSAVIENAFREGARFDAWSDHFRVEAWERAFAAAGLEMHTYAQRRLGLDEPLPWDYVAAGPSKEYLRREWEAAQLGRLTPPCGGEACRRCGACSDAVHLTTASAEPLPTPAGVRTIREATRLRFTYAKIGKWRWLSHLELKRLIEGQFRRAGVALASTAGFNPHPRLTLAPALPVGVAGREEWGEVWAIAPVEPLSVLRSFNDAGPFRMERVEAVPASAPSLEASLIGATYRIELGPVARAAGVPLRELTSRVTAALATDPHHSEVSWEKGRGPARVDVTSWDEGNAAAEVYLEGAASAAFGLAAYWSGCPPSRARAAVVTRHEVVFRPAR